VILKLLNQHEITMIQLIKLPQKSILKVSVSTRVKIIIFKLINEQLNNNNHLYNDLRKNLSGTGQSCAVTTF